MRLRVWRQSLGCIGFDSGFELKSACLLFVGLLHDYLYRRRPKDKAFNYEYLEALPPCRSEDNTQPKLDSSFFPLPLDPRHERKWPCEIKSLGLCRTTPQGIVLHSLKVSDICKIRTLVQTREGLHC